MTYIDRLAAQHVLTLLDPEARGEAIGSALEWIEHNPEHLMAFGRIERFMRASEGLDLKELSRLKILPMPPKWALPGISRRMAALAATLLIGVAAGVALFEHQSSSYEEAHYQTPRDTIRSIRLADGSNITLAGASAVSVRFLKNKRQVNLLSGEALFTVAPDRDRPFTVQTKNGLTTAVGTAFNIHRGIQDTTVTVVHGRVEVLARGAGYISRATLEPALEVQYSSTGEMSTIRRVNPESIASWRHGQFHYASTPLASIVDDLNRYSQKPIVIDDATVGQIRISGIVNANGLMEWLGALPAIAVVEVVQTPYDIHIRTRRDQNRT